MEEEEDAAAVEGEEAGDVAVEAAGAVDALVGYLGGLPAVRCDMSGVSGA